MIIHQILKGSVPQNWHGILLLEGEVRLGYIIIKSGMGITYSRFSYSSKSINGNFSETVL